MMYQVKFRESALKEWNKLGKSLQQQFAKKLKKCCEKPHISAARLPGMSRCYAITLRASGFRLVYEVVDRGLVIAAIAVGKRERAGVYQLASERLR